MLHSTELFGYLFSTVYKRVAAFSILHPMSAGNFYGLANKTHAQ